MAAKSKKSDLDLGLLSSDQFVFVEVPAPSNDNVVLGAIGEIGSVSPDVLFTVGDLILDWDEGDSASALLVALDGAEAEAAEYAAFSDSVMFVFGDGAA